MKDFGAAFIASKGEPIEYEGRKLHLAYSLPVRSGDQVRVSFVQFTSKVRQGLRLAMLGKSCKLGVAGQLLDDVVLWADTAPKQVVLSVQGRGRCPELRAWNVWEDPRRGTLLEALSSGAMEVQPQPGGAYLLRCSDGSGEPEFDDLVVVLRHEASHE